MERWLPVPGFNGRYECSNIGRIRSTDWKDTRGYLRRSKVLKQSHERNGYLQVPLTKEGKSKLYLSHRIVCVSFLLKDLLRIFVNHKNGVKDDNRLENLEWCTKSENAKHSFIIGKQNNQGINHPRCKFSEMDILNIRRKYAAGSITHQLLANEYGVSKTQIGDIVRKKSWSHIC